MDLGGYELVCIVCHTSISNNHLLKIYKSCALKTSSCTSYKYGVSCDKTVLAIADIELSQKSILYVNYIGILFQVLSCSQYYNYTPERLCLHGYTSLNSFQLTSQN